MNERLKEKQFIIGLTRLCNRFGFFIEGEIFKSYYDKIYYEEISLDHEGRDFLAPVFLSDSDED